MEHSHENEFSRRNLQRPREKDYFHESMLCTLTEKMFPSGNLYFLVVCLAHCVVNVEWVTLYRIASSYYVPPFSIK